MTAVMARLNIMAHNATQRSDLVIAVIMVLAVAMMIIPLPTVMVDTLIAANLTFSILVLAVAFYIGRPGDFSTLPPIILLATLFRLALSITTTRLILLQADAGHIVTTFGEFVIGGQIVIGLVVFMIIAAAQFIVITKGAERVAEVAARFTLDAMPGKQMSIDSDLRNGDIDQAEARAKRATLDRESQLYGAMDGAMKFVKGDAITGLIIIFVNLLGGLAVGMLSHGMSFADAGQTYALLTVGDGLIAQIPALLISLAAGIVVTRIAGGDKSSNLGAEIAGQLSATEQPLTLATVALVGAALVPGFPTPIFLILAALTGGAAFWVRRRNRKTAPEPEPLPEAAPLPEPAAPLRLGLDDSLLSEGATRHGLELGLGAGLAEQIDPEGFIDEANALRARLKSDLGLEFPAVALRLDPALAANRYQIALDGVPMREGSLPASSLLLDDDPMHADLLEVALQNGPNPLAASGPSEEGGTWVEISDAAPLTEAGVALLDLQTVLCRCLGEVMRRYAAQFIGIQEARELLATMERDYGEVLREVGQALPLTKIADILRRLIEEDVPITNLRAILEALIEWGPKDSDTSLLTERVRAALARQISHRHAQMNRVIAAYVMTQPAETALRAALKPANGGVAIILPEDQSRALVSQIRHAISVADSAISPVIIISVELRRPLRNYLIRNAIHMPVLSYPEIAPEYSVHSLMSVSIGRGQEPPTKG